MMEYENREKILCNEQRTSDKENKYRFHDNHSLW